MSDFIVTDEFVQELDRCINCGLCHGICPVYLMTGDEYTSARGKINLLRAMLSGDLTPNSHIVDMFNECLLCYGCQTVCPAGVKTENLWITSREILAREVGQSLAKKVAFRGFLGRPAMLRLGLNLIRAFQALVYPKRIQYKHLASGLTIPRLSSRTLLDDLPDRMPAAQDPPIGRVGFFVGCMCNYLLPEVANSAIRVLSKLGYEVIIPKDQLCCGAPAFNNGDFDTARKLGRWNIDVFLRSGVDMIVTADGTCGGAFTHEYSKLFGDDDPSYREFKKRCPELLTLVSQRIGEHASDMATINEEVTIHDSCHLTHTRGITDAPRRLIDAIPGTQITEKVRSNHCCGFGGSYQVMYPETSETITSARIQEALKTGAATIVASSPGCILKLREEADRERLGLKVEHPLEMLDRSLKG
jgi:glycolate oxidase iron-sulfur subunit